ncbi:arsenate reductase [Stagonosporopsis vannaccii]|nr:arsenate reductase [Stagonosporopsis vannaccii]
MKLSWGLVASSLYCTAASAKNGHVFTFDASETHAAPASSPIDPETARLILAQRLGLSRFHSIKDADAEAIKNINVYGGRQQKLFGEEADTSRAQLLVWLEDAGEGLVSKLRDASTASFEISSPPSQADNDRLIDDFIIQAESLPKLADPTAKTYSASIEADSALSGLKKTALYNDYLTVFRADKKDETESTILQDVLPGLARRGLDITVVAMPPYSANSKRRVVSPYGTYEVPPTVEARRNRQSPEALLSFTPEPSTSPKAEYPDLEDFPVFISEKKSNGTVRGILPPFFNSLASCEKTTLNCSGHGECKLLHKAQDKTQQDRFGCACSPTVIGKGNSRKVTNWAGPACQKKDISTPFWLFVGTGVMLAFLISTIIGMMYSIGSEELPSVIGAGVSGPVRK